MPYTPADEMLQVVKLLVLMLVFWSGVNVFIVRVFNIKLESKTFLTLKR
jgi:hypothetical protein